MDSRSDEQLVEEYLSGKHDALELLVQRYLQPLYNFVFSYVRSIPEAEDVTQEAFVKIWKNVHKFNKKYKFKTWAYTVAKNTALDALKKKGLVPFSQLEGDDGQQALVAALVSKQPLPEEIVSRLEDASVLNLAVRELPEKYRTVLSLYYGEGLNFREIGEQLKQSIDTVKTHHRRAIIYLKRNLLNK